MSAQVTPDDLIDHKSTWTAHLRAMLALGLPLVGAQLAQIAIHVTDTIMISRLGALPLAGSVLGTQLFFVIFIVGSGFSAAVVPLAANAQGRGDIAGVRRSVRMGLWVVLIFSLLVIAPMIFSEQIFLALKQDPEVSRIGAEYFLLAGAGLPFALALMVLRGFLSALERAQIVLWITMIGVAMNILFNWALIFGNLGMPALGVEGAAIASVATNVLMAGLLLAYCWLLPALKPYELMVRFWRPDWPGFADILRLGLPISGTLLAEVGLFSASSVLMGWLGPIYLAAHGVALQVISVIFMIPFGLAQAGTVLVGQAYGRDDHRGIDLAGKIALILAAVLAVLAALSFVLAGELYFWTFLGKETADAAAIVAIGAPLLAVAAAFQLVDSLQVVAVGLLRGLKDTRIPMWIAVFSYWAVGLPAAYILAFPLGLGGAGVWWGLAAGLSLAAVLLTHRFLARDRLGLLTPQGAAMPG